MHGVPTGAHVSVTCTGHGCPKGLTKHGYVKKSTSGTVSLNQTIVSALSPKDASTFRNREIGEKLASSVPDLALLPERET